MTIAETIAPKSPANTEPQRFPVIVIGGGQAGLSVGYQLAKRGVHFLVLDSQARVGDAWRTRWASLRLFSPAQFDGLDGMPFPAPAGSFPTKDQMADYLEAYAQRFKLPVRTNTRVESLTRVGDRYLIAAGDQRFEADHVIVAMANYQEPRIPVFAGDLDVAIQQLHSRDYRNPAQVRNGDVLVVGAGNSGAEIAAELARTHKVWLAGSNVGEVPFDIQSFVGRHVIARLLFRGVFHRLLTTDTPIGAKARTKAHGAAPLIRVKARHLNDAGVVRTPRVLGVRDGKPVLEDGASLDIGAIIWATGFEPNFSWIKLPAFDSSGEPKHTRGVAQDEPGLHFVGLAFLYAQSSSMIHGVGRDAEYVASAVSQKLALAAPDYVL
jgi:putative flavoprotein involved in K+ transport